MIYLVIMPTEKPILTFAIDEELLERLNDFRFENRIETRSEAIRMLVENALKDYEKKKKCANYWIQQLKVFMELI